MTPRQILTRAQRSAKTKANIAKSKALAEALCRQLNSVPGAGTAWGTPWITEHQFHPTRKWRFDLANIGWMVAIEIDGGIFVNGRHSRGKQQVEDMLKQTEAAVLGWCIMRFTPGDAGYAIDAWRRFLAHRGVG